MAVGSAVGEVGAFGVSPEDNTRLEAFKAELHGVRNAQQAEALVRNYVKAFPGLQERFSTLIRSEAAREDANQTVKEYGDVLIIAATIRNERS